MTDDTFRELRNGLGRFATGITVVTCTSPNGLCGITANSFSSVSLEPPRILWNLAKVSRSVSEFLDADYFAINVLSAGQEALSVHFAQTARPGFENVTCELSAHGVPLLSGTLAYFECRTFEILDCGDHYIIIGDIEDFRYGDGQPLLFFAGRYAGISG